MNFLQYVHFINTEITHASEVELNAWDDVREAEAEALGIATLHTALGYQIGVLRRGEGARSKAILNTEVAIVRTGEIPIEVSARLVKCIVALNDSPLSARVSYVANTGVLSIIQNVDIGVLKPKTLAHDFAAFVRAITVTQARLEKIAVGFDVNGYPVAFAQPDNFSPTIAARAEAEGFAPHGGRKNTPLYDGFLKQFSSRWGVPGVSALGVQRINETFAAYRTVDKVELYFQSIALANSGEAVAVTVQIAQLHQEHMAQRHQGQDATLRLVSALRRTKSLLPREFALYADVRGVGTAEVTDVSMSRVILLNFNGDGHTLATDVLRVKAQAKALSEAVEMDARAMYPGTKMYFASKQAVVTPGGYISPTCVVRKGERALKAFEQAVLLMNAPGNDEMFIAFAEMLARSFAPRNADARGCSEERTVLDLARLKCSDESISFLAFDKTEIRLTRMLGKDEQICVYASACQISCGGALPNGAPSFWQSLSTVTSPVDVVADNGGNVVMMRTLQLAGMSRKQREEEATGFWKQLRYVRSYCDQLDSDSGKTGKTRAFSMTVHNRGYHAMPSHIIDRVYSDREKLRALVISAATRAVCDSAAKPKTVPAQVERLCA